MKYASAFVLLSSFSLFSVFASESAQAADPGFYIGAGGGVYALDIDDIEYDDSAGAVRATAGYRIAPWLAIEAGYSSLFESTDELESGDVDIDGEAWDVSVRPILAIGELIDIYGRIGYAWYEVDATAQALGIDIDATESDKDLLWGGGVDFNLGDTLTLRGDVSRIEIEDTDLNFASVSVLVRF